MLLDIGLPVLDGDEGARSIRGRPRGQDVTILALTRWGQEDDRRRSKGAGIDDRPVEPVAPEILGGVLERARRDDPS